MSSPGDLFALAEAAVDGAEEIFNAGFGAPELRLHEKDGGDFATTADLLIEKHLRETLVQNSGIGVYGEESGGDLEESGATWLVDPIDGTANYAAQNPNCGILVSLLHDGRPVVAVASFPKLGIRLAASKDGGVRGLPKIAPHPQQHIGCSSQLSSQLFADIRGLGLKPRISGSVGLDLAFAAMGVMAGAINFSPHPWDSAAGVLLLEEAGKQVSAADGSAWKAGADGVVAGEANTHESLLELIH